MRFSVSHLTAYQYDAPVRLAPHVLRLRPRDDGRLRLLACTLHVDPAPAAQRVVLDLDGNVITLLRFDDWPARELRVTSRFTLDTAAAQPEDERIAWSALDPLRARLAPWTAAAPAAAVTSFALALRESGDTPLRFLRRLNTHLHQHLRREIRESGAAQAPEQTLAAGVGACRDLAMLFIAACRSQGLAARFVSGYQAGGDESRQRDRRYMHAWPEVYLPGCGWCGFDPTHGTAVADAHVALAAAAHPDDAAPLTGSYFGSAGSTLRTELQIDVDASPR